MDDRFERLTLTPEQWVGLLNEEGAWLPRCCASIHATRDVLAKVLAMNGALYADDARTILAEVGDHHGDASEGIAAILAGRTGTHFWTAEGSPWFAIVRACRALLGDGDILAQSSEWMRQRNAEACRAEDATERALDDVKTERRRQDAKWGVQNHPFVGHAARRRLTLPHEECARLGLRDANNARCECDRAHRLGFGTYTHILIEETAEFVEACVIHGETSDEARKELVQTAAVAVAMLESLDRAREQYAKSSR